MSQFWKGGQNPPFRALSAFPIIPVSSEMSRFSPYMSNTTTFNGEQYNLKSLKKQNLKAESLKKYPQEARNDQ